MKTGQPSSLQLPSFLHGPFLTVQRKVRTEGRRCAEQYQKDGSFPAAREVLAVPAEVLVLHEVADFQREHPAWRLYLLGGVTDALCEALDWKNSRQVSDLYETFSRETAWGALYYAVSQEAPMSAGRMAARLHAVLRFWEPLHSVRYRFKSLNAELSLEELMMASCDWAMEAWAPLDEASIEKRLAVSATRMAQATRDDSTEAILREMPRALAHARGLKHRERLTDPAFLRHRLSMLEPAAFERVSGAFTAHLLELLYDWDEQLGKS
ncbi:hypothetical protein [Hyalangium versicolor]|uniref:hypothetical protein n=1 Tax=Hyalangium versicolor TaxID=2861190 RepID=UPI001CCC390F|nr:hypothetical protein [Hyalangium versicolor]